MLAAIALSACSKPDSNALYQELKSTDKLVFASMAISKTATMESPEIILLGKRVAVYSYNTYMQAYIDLSQLQPSDIVYNDDNHTVQISLPAVQTELAGRDMQMHRVYENVGLLRPDLDSKERAQIKEKANASLQREVATNPAFRNHLIDAAQRKARQYFESLVEPTGYTPVITFKTDAK